MRSFRQASVLSERHFPALVTGLVAFYTAIELLYVLRLPLVMDEFDGAYEVYRLLRDIPYRDYAPYKTVLGYYINLPGALAATEMWQRIILMKGQLVLINAAALAAAAFILRRIIGRPAVVLALALLIVNTAFLERSAELRVDMLTAWAGLASLLLILLCRPAWAGAACGLSFCISQKGAFYFVAANAALLAEFVRTRAKFALRELIAFNAGFGAVIGLYVGFWSLFSPSVIRTVFVSGAEAGALNVYAIRERFWSQIILRNPMYFALIAAGLWLLAAHVMRGRAGRTQLLILVYAAAVLVQMIVYPQPWPYQFVILLPTTFVLHAALFDTNRTAEHPFGLTPLVLLATLAAGVIYPASRIPIAASRDNSYQKYNVRLAAAMLEPGDTYLAGTDIVYEHEQSLPALQRLGGPPLAALRAAPPEVSAELIRALQVHPPKLIVETYRVSGLPAPLLAFIDAHYTRLSGSILGYAPLLEPGSDTLPLAFGGRYLLDSRVAAQITVDGREYPAGTTIPLAAGIHRIRSPQALRLRLVPEGIEPILDGRFTDEQEFYPNVYGY